MTDSRVELIAAQFRERYGDIGASWRDVVQYAADALARSASETPTDSRVTDVLNAAGRDAEDRWQQTIAPRSFMPEAIYLAMEAARPAPETRRSPSRQSPRRAMTDATTDDALVEEIARAICAEAGATWRECDEDVYNDDWRVSARAAYAILAPRLKAYESALLDCGASLAAAVSLLERGGKAAKKAAPSDKMFDQMIKDYKASIDRTRAALEPRTGE